MAARRYQYSWDDIAGLDADFMAGWGAFEPGCRQTIDLGDDDLPKLALVNAADGTAFTVTYQWPKSDQREAADFIHVTIHFERRPCRLGGSRRFFICPSCGRRTLRLAVLRQGLVCGSCGRVTWGSRREQPLQRLMRKADKLSERLGGDSWRDTVSERPMHMRTTTFERLKAERDDLVVEINRRIGVRLSRSGGLMRAIGTMCKIGR